MSLGSVDQINSILSGRPSKIEGASNQPQAEKGAKLNALKEANEVKQQSILKLINESLGMGKNVDIKA